LEIGFQIDYRQPQLDIINNQAQSKSLLETKVMNYTEEEFLEKLTAFKSENDLRAISFINDLLAK